ncbi:MAG: MarC family protein [Elusimicrobia bacterium]|nr:MarC family protein [Elusimicrobiota bacterium]MBP9128369.1 MarC family protein [Elusimicrobiota bacterium]
MDSAFVITIFFTLLGPIKIIPAFAGLTQGTDQKFKRAVAVRGALLASALCAFIVLAGTTLVSRFHLQVDAIRIAGGLVLLISALNVIFAKPATATPTAQTRTPMQIAVSPLAVPVIVTHAGVAAILILLLHESVYPGLTQVVVFCLALMMVLDFLVMYFNDAVLKIPGLTLALAVVGSVLIFIQACLATQMILVGLKLMNPGNF